jgi:hypothetical protein
MHLLLPHILVAVRTSDVWSLKFCVVGRRCCRATEDVESQGAHCSLSPVWLGYVVESLLPRLY